MDKKYELTKETILVNGKTLYRIRALKDFNDVKKGDLGGYVESEDNLSHDGNCWIYYYAKVFENAKVFDNAKAGGQATVAGSAKILNNAKVFDNAKVHGQATVAGSAKVCGDAWVFGDAKLYGNCRIYDKAKVFGRSKVHGQATVAGSANICGDAKVYEDAKVCGCTKVNGNAIISGNALLTSDRDFSVVSKFGSEDRSTTFFRCEDGLVRVNCGCFYGTIDEFRKNVKVRHGRNQYAKEYLMIAKLMKMRFSE